MKSYKTGLILICFMLTSCNHLSLKDDYIFSGFNILPLPKECVPVGAKWVDIIGPLSNSCTGHDTSKTRSISSLSLDSRNRIAIQSNIALYLKSNGLINSSSNIELNDIEIVTANYNNFDNFSNSTYIHEAIRVKSILVSNYNTAGLDTSADIPASLGANLTINMLSNSSAKITGVNLFVAYRLISVNEPELRISRKQFKENKPVEINNYIFSISDQQLKNCRCEIFFGTRGSCNQNNITINYAIRNKPDIVKSFSYNTSKNNLVRPGLETRENARFIERDYFYLNYDLNPSVLYNRDEKTCSFYQFAYSGSFIEVQTQRYLIKNAKNQKAVGW